MGIGERGLGKVDVPPQPPKGGGDFETFWKAFPRRIGKGEAARKWAALKPPLDAVLKALAWQVPAWTDPKFIPHPTTWLNRHGWLDEPEPKKTGILANL